jgi:DNA transformation protein
MPELPDFVSHVLDLLSGWNGVTLRRMFGGYGLYHRGVHFALIADDTLYFKVDEHSRRDFEIAGTRPFVYRRQSKTVALSYWEAPAELFDDPEAMGRWARRAVDAATATRKARRHKGRG